MKNRFAPLAARVARIARAEVGYHEGRSGGHWNNVEKYAGQVPGLEWANGQPWCAVGCSWVAMEAHVSDFYPRTASCDTALAWWKARGQLHDYPAVGAQVLYGVPGNAEHCGIVVDFDATFVYVVEFNTNDNGSREGDGVYLKKRPRRDAWILGYGYPKFVRPLRSADPAYNAAHGIKGA